MDEEEEPTPEMGRLIYPTTIGVDDFFIVNMAWRNANNEIFDVFGGGHMYCAVLGFSLMRVARRMAQIVHIKIIGTCAMCLDVLSSNELRNRSETERTFIDDLGYTRRNEDIGSQIGKDIVALPGFEYLHFIEPSICEYDRYYQLFEEIRHCRRLHVMTFTNCVFKNFNRRILEVILSYRNVTYIQFTLCEFDMSFMEALYSACDNIASNWRTVDFKWCRFEEGMDVSLFTFLRDNDLLWYLDVTECWGVGRASDRLLRNYEDLFRGVMVTYKPENNDVDSEGNIAQREAISRRGERHE